MKLKTIAAAAAFATLGTSASAQTYVGVSIGSSDACFTYDVTGDCTKNGTAGKALVGYAFPGTDFAIEGIYSHLGTFKGSSQFGGVDVKVDTVGVGGAWRPQFGAGWGGVVRGGLALGRAKADFTFVQSDTQAIRLSSSNDYWQPYLGVGATYALTPSIRLEAELDVTRVKVSSSPTNVHTVMLGATFGF